MNFDVAVVGAGMVGGAVACALGRAGVRVALLDAGEAPPPPEGERFDGRVSALSPVSRRILERLGAWERLSEARVGRFDHMRVWDAGGSGAVHFDGARAGYSPMGYIVENRAVVAALESCMAGLDTVRAHRPVTVTALEPRVGGVVVEAGTARVRAALVVGADGGHSRVRELAGLEADVEDYGQSAVVATVRPREPHAGTAWQRFLPTGPLAFLPLPGGRCSIVWSTTPEEARRLVDLPDAGFASELEAAFDGRLGPIECSGPRAAFPLRRMHARGYVADRIAVVGDAAHTIHPLAGQGVNLGLLDAAALSEVVLAARERGRDPGRRANLRPYERWRKGHNALVSRTMSAFKQVFGSQRPDLRLARNLGLAVTDRVPALKDLFVRFAAGEAGDLPRLARGA